MKDFLLAGLQAPLGLCLIALGQHWSSLFVVGHGLTILSGSIALALAQIKSRERHKRIRPGKELRPILYVFTLAILFGFVNLIQILDCIEHLILGEAQHDSHGHGHRHQEIAISDSM